MPGRNGSFPSSSLVRAGSSGDCSVSSSSLMSAPYLILPPFECDCGVELRLDSSSVADGCESRRNCTCLECDGMLGEEVLMCDPRREESEREGEGEGEGGCSMVHICQMLDVY